MSLLGFSPQGTGTAVSGSSEAPAPAARTVQTVTTTVTGGSTTSKTFVNPGGVSASLTTTHISYQMPCDCMVDSLTFTVTTAPGTNKSYSCKVENNLKVIKYNDSTNPTETIDKDIEFIEAKVSDNETSATSGNAAVFFRKNDALQLSITPDSTPTIHGNATITFKIWQPDGKQVYFSRYPVQSTNSQEVASKLVNTDNTSWSTTLSTYDVTANIAGTISDIMVSRDSIPTGSDSVIYNIKDVTTGEELSQIVDSTTDDKVDAINLWNDGIGSLDISAGDTLRFTNTWNGASTRFSQMTFCFTPFDPTDDLLNGSTISSEGPISTITLNSNTANVTSTGFRVKFQVKEHRNDYLLQVATDSNFNTIVKTETKQSSQFSGIKGDIKIYMVQYDVTGLDAETQYYYRLSSNSTPDSGFSGQCKTFPATAAPVSSETDTIYWGSCLDIKEDTLDVSGTDRYTLKTIETMAATPALVFVDLGDRTYSNLPSVDTGLQSERYVAYRNHPVIKNMLKVMPDCYTPSDHDAYGAWGDTNLVDADESGLYPDPDLSAPHGLQAIHDMFAVFEPKVEKGDGGYLQPLSTYFDIRRTRHIVLDTQFARYKNNPGTMIGDGSQQEGANHTATATPNVKSWLDTLITQSESDGIKLIVIYLGGSKIQQPDGWHATGWLAEFKDIGDMIKNASTEIIVTHCDFHHSLASDLGDQNGGANRFTTSGTGRYPIFVVSPLQDSVVDGLSAWNLWNGVRTGSLIKAKYGIIKVTDDGGDDLDYTVENRDINGNLLTNATSGQSTQWSNRDVDRELNFTASTDSVSSGAGTYSLRVLKSWFGKGRFHLASTGTGSTLIDADYETLPNSTWLDITVTLTGSGTTTFTLTAHSTNPTNSTIGSTNQLVLTIS